MMDEYFKLPDYPRIPWWVQTCETVAIVIGPVFIVIGILMLVM